MNYDVGRPTSRVIQPPGGGSSNIFGDTTTTAPVERKKVNPNYSSSIFGEEPTKTSPTKPAVRRDPITGEVVNVNGTRHGDNRKVEEEKEDKIETPGVAEVEEEAKEVPKVDYEPHLGEIRNTSGVRCAQPPGGRSSFTFG